MQHTHARNWALTLISATAVASLTFAVAPTATAAPVEGAVIATGPALASEPPDATVVGVDANIVAGLTITGHRGKPVTVTTAGEATRAVTAKPSSPIVVRKLTPGKTYAVSIAGKRIATATPLAQVTPSGSLTVRVGSEPGTVDLAWAHRAKPAHGQVTFAITATAQNRSARSTATIAPISTQSRSPIATLSGLDPQTLYRFDVVARNSASSSAPTTAVMTRTLADLTGVPAQSVDPVAIPTPVPASASPQPTSGSTGGGSSAPTTRTVYMCPDGFSENAGMCEQTASYTFHTETQTVSYTYTYGITGTETFTDTCSSGYTDADGNFHWVEQPHACTKTRNVYGDIKNPTPAGYSDNGSAWVKDIQVKDAAPAGYADNGTAWVTTTAKVARTVTA